MLDKKSRDLMKKITTEDILLVCAKAVKQISERMKKMIRNLGKNRILWLLVALLSLIAALVGVSNPGIYGHVVSTKIMPGVLSQDLMTIVASIIVLFLIVRIKEKDSIKQMVILGIIGYLFYGYGIYVIERLYNVLYFVYMAIFGLSFYSIVYSVANIRKEMLPNVQLPKPIRIVSVGFLLINPLIFYPLWISQLLPLIQSSQKIEFIYSIYILDLCFILPLFIIVAMMTAKNEGLGLLLTPALLVKGFTLLFSVALGGILKPLYHKPGDTGEIWLFLSLSIVFLVLTVVYFRKLTMNSETV